MKTSKNAKGLALAIAGAVLAAGTAAVSIPALANTNKGKTTNKTVKVKDASSKAKSALKLGTNTTPQPPKFGDNDGDGPGDRHGRGGFGGPAAAQALKDVLADLVTKGTITQEQSDAITSALQAKRDAAMKAASDFRSKADGIIAEVLGLTVDEFNAKRADRTLPKPTDAQRAEIKTKLDALRTSLGLPAGGPGRGDGDGPGMGDPGMGAPGFNGPGFGTRGGHHAGKF